jgi:hypothetical protein
VSSGFTNCNLYVPNFRKGKPKDVKSQIYETEQSVSIQQSGNFSFRAARTQFQKGEVHCLVGKLQLPLFPVEEKQGFKHIKTVILVTVPEFFSPLCFGSFALQEVHLWNFADANYMHVIVFVFAPFSYILWLQRYYFCEQVLH